MMLKEKIVRFCLLLLRLGMGGFFLFVAARKLLHLDQLQETIDRFAIFPEARGLSLSCNCIGVERVVTSYPFEVAWRLVLFFLMLILLWDSCRKGKTYFNVTRLDFSEM